MVINLPTERMQRHSDKDFFSFLPTRWRRKAAGIDIKQNYVTVTLCTGWAKKVRPQTYDHKCKLSLIAFF